MSGRAHGGAAAGGLGWDAQDESALLAGIVACAPDAIISVAAADGRILTWNRAAERLFGYSEREALGAPLTMLAPESAADPDELLAAALAGHRVGAETMRRRKDGTLIDVSLTAARIQMADGRIIGAVGVFRDITERKKAEASRRETEAQFRVLADAMPQMVWSATAAGRVDYYNRRWQAFIGQSTGELTSVDWAAAIHPEDRARAWQAWHEAVATGEAYEDEYRLRRHDGAYRWFLDRALPLRDRTGQILRWFGTCTDIDEQKHAEDARRLLIQELNHRVKNLFAVTAGIVAVSARRAGSVGEMAEAVRGRLGALARAHDLVRAAITGQGVGHESTTLRDVAAAITAPHASHDGRRIAIDGPPVGIGASAAASIALVLHELATNAVKYGALSTPVGRVGITWTIEESQLSLDWRESGGPVIETPPSTEGFGTQVTRMSVTGQLGGTVATWWERAGVRVAIAIPLERLQR